MQGNWQKNGVGDFKYYVGISSLTQVASRDDRVCVLNILGGESSDVTPVSHVYSGGNVVCGTAPGKGGAVLETSIGNIPVYNSVRDALVAGRRFNCGVVYLPPSAARDGVAELIRVNPDLRKVFIITEKIAVHDAREIRAMGQHNGVDIFGANGLGVADSWNKVRIGGALGGDKPGDSLRPGSIAILSNSGGFSTTIAQYLRMPRADGSVNPEQRPEADVNIEFQSASKLANESMKLAFLFRDANEKYATDYPAAVGHHMSNTDSTPFIDLVPSISLRENERGMQIGAGWNPHYHEPTDLYSSYSDKDFRLGLNAAQTTLGGVARLAGTTLKK